MHNGCESQYRLEGISFTIKNSSNVTVRDSFTGSGGLYLSRAQSWVSVDNLPAGKYTFAASYIPTPKYKGTMRFAALTFGEKDKLSFQ